MSDSTPRPYAAFRLNLGQQKKRAKDLLKAVRAGDTSALLRLQHAGGRAGATHSPQLADAQHCIARELRFRNWAALKLHVASMEQACASIHDQVLDDDCRTMHIRCGDDIRHSLQQAGLHGTFNRHISPYLQGPVTAASDWLEQRARFIARSAGVYDKSLTPARVSELLNEEEQGLASASSDYERVVLWLEHDRYDQFVLLRCLAWFAEHGAPPRLELVGPGDFPGGVRFLGLGQLPPEALRLLWQQRKAVTNAQIGFGREVWRAFREPDPTALAAYAQRGTPLLPHLANALQRHLQELPAPGNGLGLTRRLLLSTLAGHDSLPVGHLVGTVMQNDPLPGLGDTGYDLELREMEKCSDALVWREYCGDAERWQDDRTGITPLGQAVLDKALSCLSLRIPERWVGGVRIAAGEQNWHWDEHSGKAVLL